jgi:hypothetical protein
MYKFKIIFPLLVTVFMVTAGYCQKDLENHQIKTVAGMATGTDFVGSTIDIMTTDQRQMTFYVPSGANMTRGTQDIGLMDIKQGHSVTIQYYTSSPGKDIVVSIVDNKPIAR